MDINHAPAEVVRVPAARIVGRETPDETPILIQYWRILWRRKWIVLGTIAVALLIGAIVTVMATRQYFATTTLELTREVDIAEGVQGVVGQPRMVDMEYYQTQYGLLRARSLARRVAEELNLAEDEQFRAAFNLDEDSGLFADAPTGPLTRNERAERVDQAEQILLENISVRPTLESRLVEVGFSSPNPRLSARIANAWAQFFIESGLERRFQSASYARDFLERRLGQVRERLETAERALVGYATLQGIVGINSDVSGGDQQGEQSVAGANLGLLNNALGAATADRIRAQSRLQQARGSTSEGLTNSGLSVMRQRRAEVAAELAQLLVTFEPEYPQAQALQSQVDSLDQAIAREEARVRGSLQHEYASALQREDALRAQVQRAQAEVLDLRRRGIQYNILQRDVDTSRELYQALLQRYKEVGVAGGVGRNNVSVVDLAVPPEKPSSPRPVLNMFLALLLGSVAGVGLAFGRHQLDEAIADPEDLSNRLGIPTLGTIPRWKGDDIVDALNDRKSELSEGYMAVRTNLQFSTPSGVPRTLVVTSSGAAEGKSTSALGLAIVLARLGSRVLLVDADLRSPSIHQSLNLANGKGLSNCLTGQMALKEVVQETSNSGLFAITSGPLPPNAAELIAGDGADRLLAAAKEQFDYVVVDAPPVLGLADAPLLGSKAEAVALVVEAGSTKARVAERAIGRLLATHSHLTGAILTKFDARFASYDYGEAYGYGYGKDIERSA